MKDMEKLTKEINKLADLEFEYMIVLKYCEDDKEIKRIKREYEKQRREVNKLYEKQIQI